MSGGTWYRGQWRSARSLGTSGVVHASGVSQLPCKPPAGVTVRPRLTAICYNIGGVTQECYDLFKHWLQTRCTADVVILTETHLGSGKRRRALDHSRLDRTYYGG